MKNKYEELMKREITIILSIEIDNQSTVVELWSKDGVFIGSNRSNLNGVFEPSDGSLNGAYLENLRI